MANEKSGEGNMKVFHKAIFVEVNGCSNDGMTIVSSRQETVQRRIGLAIETGLSGWRKACLALRATLIDTERNAGKARIAQKFARDGTTRTLFREEHVQ